MEAEVGKVQAKTKRLEVEISDLQDDLIKISNKIAANSCLEIVKVNCRMFLPIKCASGNKDVIKSLAEKM